MRRVNRTALFALIAIPLLAACASPEVPMIEIPNALWIDEGILSGGQPDEAQLRQAAESGYRTVVNLRGPGEEGSLPDEEAVVRLLGMDYQTIPIADAAALNEANARKLATLIEDVESRPILLHCRSGNRIGTLMALKSFHLDGVDGAEAYAIGQRAGMRKPPAEVLQLLGVEPEPEAKP